MITQSTDLGAAIETAERDAVVVWRGERIPFLAMPARIAATDNRIERDGLYESTMEAVEALNPAYRARHAAHRDPRSTPAELAPLATELGRFAVMSETEYHAALRRYLALIGIEHGDATLADVWHIERGAAWSNWFGTRDVGRAAVETGRPAPQGDVPQGWRGGWSALAGEAEGGTFGASVVRDLHGWLVGDPTWLASVLHMAADEIASFADFAAFARLWQVRLAIGIVLYEVRLAETRDEALERAYFSGIVGHMTGVAMPEAAYLRFLGTPGSAAADVERAIVAAAMADRLETRFGPAWWSVDDARSAVVDLEAASTVEDALAKVGYDALDWRPLLRQIRTRLIGEMSGYGGPNITTRAGTRKV